QVSFTALATAAAKVNMLAGPAGAGPAGAGAEGSAATGWYLQVLGAGGFTGSSSYDVIQMQIDLGQVTEPDYYDLGGYSEVLVPSFGVPAGVLYITDRELCYSPQGGYQIMMFFVSSVPSYADCNCGVTFFGSLTIEEFGTELTDVVSGGISAYLSGWKGCTCYCCEDVDGDGQEDDWVVDCAKAKLSLEFEVIVGSLMSSRLNDIVQQAEARRLQDMTGPGER
ncbi:MAG: hypothetical protein PVJ42_10005, partial [bacterium]